MTMKVVGHKINTQKAIVILYSTEIEEIPCTQQHENTLKDKFNKSEQHTQNC